MKKKVIIIFIAATLAAGSLMACKAATDEENSVAVSSETDKSVDKTDTSVASEASTEDESYASIQEEIEAVQKKSDELVTALENEDMNQTDMTENATERYNLWDEELNSLWSRLSEELDEDTKASLLDEQRQWISRKDNAIKAVGEEAEGGSLQPFLEADTGADLTEVRVYKLAEILAELRGEDFVISDEIQATLDSLDPDIDTVFGLFEGIHTMYTENGDFDDGFDAGVQQVKDADIDSSSIPDGATWVVWITDKKVFTDKDVYTFSPDSITFKLSDDSYAKISENMAGGMDISFGADSDCVDETIFSDD